MFDLLVRAELNRSYVESVQLEKSLDFEMRLMFPPTLGIQFGVHFWDGG